MKGEFSHSPFVCLHILVIGFLCKNVNDDSHSKWNMRDSYGRKGIGETKSARF